MEGSEWLGVGGYVREFERDADGTRREDATATAAHCIHLPSSCQYHTTWCDMLHYEQEDGMTERRGMIVLLI